MINTNKNLKISIIGLGYVGLSLALEFSKKRKVIGFDVNEKRIKELKSGVDKNLEFNKKEIFKNLKKLHFTNNKNDLKSTNCFIITVPTPINKFKNPDLRALFKATEIVSKNLKKRDLIIYESTVYPGCIEEQCVPIIEKLTGFNFNEDFFCGYSPERVNPGDKKHTLSKIKKITSGSTPKVADIVDELYKEIITGGTHKTSSIKVAEAAKIIENTQRDVNIALMNELSVMFYKMKIDTKEVLDAASTKWNFLPFKPGLVGGNCIGVDSYYLTYKARQVGYEPKVILAGTEINNIMAKYVTTRLLKSMKEKNIKIKKAKILIMGLTYKENCSGIFNSGIEKVIKKLKKFNCTLNLYDPWADKEGTKKIYDIYPHSELSQNTYDAIIISVGHKKFKTMGIKAISNLCKKNHIIYDLKNLFTQNKNKNMINMI
jgi:UDP-N-acetyl-D-galactosamine dehydrogenase